MSTVRLIVWNDAVGPLIGSLTACALRSGATPTEADNIADRLVREWVREGMLATSDDLLAQAASMAQMAGERR